MKSKMHKFIFVLAAILICNVAGAQGQEFSIDEGGTQSTNNCQHTLVLTDSNADDGNYLPNENHQITMCFNTVEGNPLQFAILPSNSAGTNVWDVDGDSELFVYEGDNTGAPLIGVFNTETDPNGVFFTTTSTCLTFVFTSGASSSGAGFRARINCAQELQPFNANVIIEEPHGLFEDTIPGLEGKNVITFCYLDTLKFTAVPNFPLSVATGNGYEQLTEECTFIWDMGDGTVVEGVGLTEFEHVYTDLGGFFARLRIIDVNGRMERYEAYMLMAPRVIFSNDVFNDTLCIGDTTQITGGILGLDTVGVGPNNSLVNLNFNFTDSIAIPDGSGVSYFSEIDIFGFSNDPVISTSDDFIEICMNMEHSYLGDLEIALICPNGQEVILKQYPGGGGTYLGSPIDQFPDQLGVPGEGFDYCFSASAEWGTMLEENAAGNHVTAGLPPGNSMSPGTYSAFEDFDNLIGCPVNGLWQLKFTDYLLLDDGFLFGWNLEFNPDFEIDTIRYSPDIVDAYWLENPDIVVNNDTIITVVPSAEGGNAFTFVAEDSFGCIHDTTYIVYVRPDVIAADDIACDLTHLLTVQNAVGGGNWEMVSSPSENSTVEFEDQESGFSEITVNEYGIYEFLITEFNCNYQDTAAIDFRPDPQVQPFVPDTVLCNNASIIFEAGPQEDNSDNFSINWTLDGSTFNTTDLSVDVDQTGQYVLTLSGVCGTASDTSDVVAIQLEFRGDTLCGLDVPGVQVSLEPPGSGTWSSPDDNISFENPEGLITSINSTEYGPFEVMFTDSRCPDDGEVKVFRFVEQPVVSILPEAPEFCVDLDSLHLETMVTGNSTGDFTWTVSGSPSNISAGEISFGPEEFDPLETHIIEVRTVDNFGVCPVAAGSISFFGQWCTYHIPNVVTPNGDGRNDTWDIQFIEFFPGTQIRVFNRWGQQVFENNDYDRYQSSRNGRGWDPEDLKEGVYFYEILIPAVDKVESGNLTIARELIRRRR